MGIVLGCMPLVAKAGGFQLNEQGARAMAMGFAVVSDAADATTLFYNPSGMMSLRDGWHISLGITGLLPLAKFSGPTNLNKFATVNMAEWLFALPHFYAAYNIPNSDVAVGLGVFVPFGAGTRWDENWTGRNLAIRTYLQTVTINPNVAYSLLNNKLAVSAGVSYSLGRAELRNKIINVSPEPVLNLVGEGGAFSGNISATYEPAPYWRVGVSYRHNIAMTYRGTARYSLDAEGETPLPSGLANLFVDGSGSTALNLPFDLKTGVSYRFNDIVMAEVGVDVVGWGSYDTLRISFDRLPGNPTSAGTLANARNYYLAPIFRVGTEILASDMVKLRFGSFFDLVPVAAANTQPILPDADRLGMSTGIGITFSRTMSLDISYMFVYGFQREVRGSPVNFDGIYNSWAHAAALTLNIGF